MFATLRFYHTPNLLTALAVRFLVMALIVLTLLFLAAPFAFAQTTDNTISLHRIFGGLLEPIAAGAGVILFSLCGWVAAMIQRKTGIEIEFLRSQTLQASLTNAAGKVSMALGDKLKDVKFEINNPVIRDAVLYVIDAAPQAVAHFGLTKEAIAEKIINKIGVITASNSEVNPQSTGSGGAG